MEIAPTYLINLNIAVAINHGLVQWKLELTYIQVMTEFMYVSHVDTWC